MSGVLKHYLPSLGKSWLMVLVFFAGSLILGGLLSYASPDSFWRSTSFMYICSFIPVALFIWFDAKASAARGGGAQVPVSKASFGRINPVLFFLLIAVGVVALNIVVEPLTSLIPMPDSIKALFEDVFDNSSLADTLISTVIMAPLCEEFLCRGIICRGLLTRMKPWKAILWSATIFAVLHANPFQGIPALVLGCFFGWVYYRTHDIWAAMFLHALNNLLSVLITRFFPNLPVDATFKDIVPDGSYYILYAAAAVLFAGVVFLLWRRLDRNNSFRTAEKLDIE